MDSVNDQLERWAAIQPEKLLFEFRDGHGKAIERHTYRSFYERTLLLAWHLAKFSGLIKGDRVLLAYPPGLEGIATLLACSRAGLIGVPVPLPQSESSAAYRRLRAVGYDCGATALLSNGPRLPRLRQQLTESKDAPSPPWRLFNTDDFVGEPDARAERKDNMVFFLQYTSGSTGQPRGVIVTHDNVVANAHATLDHVPTGVSWLPQHHDMGLIGYYLFPIVTGGTNVGFAPSDFLRRPALWLRTISEFRATHSSSPNFGYEYCLQDGKIHDEDLEGVDLSCVRVLMNASEPVRPRTVLRFHRRFARYGLQKSACTVAYGLAENTLTVTHGGLGFVQVDRKSLGAQRAVLADNGDAKDAVEYACCGVPASGVSLRICDLESGRPLDSMMVGDIQVAGASVTRGYWNNDELTNSMFATDSLSRGGTFDRYIRTGDLGFLYGGALYICGRSKDLIIIGGVNFYPEDIEEAIDAGGAAIRARGSCAFQTEDGSVVVVVEAARRETVPDPAAIAETIRKACSVMPDLVLIVDPKTVAKTTSGKIARAQTRALFASGALPVLASYRADASSPNTTPEASGDWRSQLRRIFTRHGASNEALPLADLGIDSLALTELQLEVEETLRRAGADALGEALDGQLLQRLSLNDLLSVLAPLDCGLAEGVSASLAALSALHVSLENAVQEQMRHDSRWQLSVDMGFVPASTGRDILLTGATGFFGPFLLGELLRQTDATVLVLVRARTPAHALERIEAALSHAQLLTPALRQALAERVRPVCGDLALPFWGLARAEWSSLASRVREIFHNGACVNYVMPYEAMRSANVEGTHTALQLAFEGGARTLHLISSTFIFGWTARGTLLETDCNAEKHALDFGYTQSKWVAEQLALGARARGLDVRIYRPALISVSTSGIGDANDVALRMLDFMIRHSIAVDTPNQLSILPADVIAHNIIGISQLGGEPYPALHVTADRYYSMTELTRVISRDFGCPFEYYDIPGFINQLNRRCSPRDPVYPLLDFFNRSADKIAAMRLKLYNNSAYQHARARLRDPRPDPSLEETAGYIMRYLGKSLSMPVTQHRQPASGR